jgi:CRP-like cAMP-binding protein
VLLEPPQRGPRLSALAGPYAEVDGRPQTVHLKYRSQFESSPRKSALAGRDGRAELTEVVSETSHLPTFDMLPGEAIGSRGMSGAALLLVSGRLRLVRHTARGRRLAVAELDPPSLLPTSRLGPDEALAVLRSSVRSIDVPSLIDIFERRPTLALESFQLLGEQLKAADARLESLACESVLSRLADCLLRLGLDGREVAGLTHQDLGDLVCAYRETVTKVLHRLESEGAVGLEPRRIVLLDMPQLRRLARSAST